MKILDFIGNTPLIEIEDNDNKIFFKFEGTNIFGSSKDRSAVYVLKKLLNDKVINHETTIIESSSGNMGIALAAICKILGLRFICVVDPHISPVNEYLIINYGGEIIKVDEVDENNSYLKTRIKTVNQLKENIDNSYWFNQYSNPLVCEAYMSIAYEMVEQLPAVDYIFIAVSSAGTISGISNAIKEKNPNIKIIAVDVKGSKVFDSQTNTKRHLSGIGSSIRSINLDSSKIDDIILVNEKDGVLNCRELLQKHLIFAGGSSGCVYSAIKEYINLNNIKNKNIIGLLNDRGDRYVSNVYNDDWCEKKFGIKEN